MDEHRERLEDLERELGQQIRRTLVAVADHACALEVNRRPALSDRRRRWRQRGWITAAAVGVAALGAVAWNALESGDIERIPVEAALMHGQAAEGGDWWLIPSQALHEPFADVPSTCAAMVEIVASASNRPGLPWRTGGVSYGEPSASSSLGCLNEATWLADPTKLNMGATRLGPGDDPDTAWGFFAAVHPTVGRVEVHADGELIQVAPTRALKDRPDGPRFTAFTVPADTSVVEVKFLDRDGTVITSVTETMQPG